MEIMTVAGIAVAGAAAAVLLHQYKPEYAFAVSLVVGVVILAGIAGNVAPVVERLRALLESSGMKTEHGVILVKSLGICFVTQIACDACRDCGQSAIAGKVELAGKAAMLLLALPLFEELLSLAATLVNAV